MGMAKVLPRSPGKPRSSRPAPARRVRSRPSRGSIFSDKARRGRRKFLRLCPGGFGDETYLNWERGYKWQAHRQWQAAGEADLPEAYRREAFSRDCQSRAADRVANKFVVLL